MKLPRLPLHKIYRRKKLLALLALAAIAITAVSQYKPEAKASNINVIYAGVLPEESIFNIQTGKYIDVGETAAREDLKTRVLKTLGLAPARLTEKQAFYIKMNVQVGAPNITMVGLEYSNVVFSEIRPADNSRYPLLFIYKSPVDEKTVKRYLLNDTEGKFDLVGIAGEITVIKDSQRSIADSIRITLHNATQNTDEPVEALDYRITVCGKKGC